MDKPATRGLGTQLRHLLELLDGGVDEIYRLDGLEYRPRYTPIVRALESKDALSIKEIAQDAGISHSAASQTISKMISSGLVEHVTSKDGRERLIKLTKRSHQMLPSLHSRWRAVQLAADELDAEFTTPLSQIVEQAIKALTERSFSERIAAQDVSMQKEKS